MLIARHNALEVDGHVARRYIVYGCRIRHGAIIATEVAETPAETLQLPLPRREATDWLLLYFEDLAPAEYRAALADLTTLRPVSDRA